MTHFATSTRALIALIFSCFLLTGCHQKPKQEPFNAEGYRLLKGTFYEDKDGNIYEKKYQAQDNINSEKRHFYDPNLFFPNYPEKIALKDILDIESFEQFEDFTFSKDKKHVYFARATSDGAFRFVVHGANPKTFKPLKWRWAADDQHVYFGSQIVSGADLKTFRVSLNDQDSAYDVNRLYLNGKPVQISKD